jgi:hypothetical protein
MFAWFNRLIHRDVAPGPSPRALAASARDGRAQVTAELDALIDALEAKRKAPAPKPYWNGHAH